MEATYSLMQYLHIDKDLEASELQREFTSDTQIVGRKHKNFIIFSLASFFNDITWAIDRIYSCRGIIHNNTLFTGGHDGGFMHIYISLILGKLWKLMKIR